MTYSVFDWERGLYHYFEGPGEKLGIRPKPRKVWGELNGRGRQLETLLVALPPGCTRAGTGPEPRGRIAVLDGEPRTQMNATPTTSDSVDEIQPRRLDEEEE